MNTENTNLAEFDNEIIGRVLIDVFNYRIENPRATVKDACTELNLSYQSVLRWIKDGRFQQYLAEIHDIRSDIAQATALDQLPLIVKHMADVALGRTTMRGQNPQAAAEFVLKVAQVGAHGNEYKQPTLVQTNVYMPDMKNDQREVAPSGLIDI